MSGAYVQTFNPQASNAADGVTPPTTPAPLDGTFSVTATMVTLPWKVENWDAYSVQITLGGGSTLVATATLEVSNDNEMLNLGPQAGGAGSGSQGPARDYGLGNFTPISVWDFGAGAQAANKAIATGANSILIGERVCGYRWARLRIAFTSGAGSPIVRVQAKGYR